MKRTMSLMVAAALTITSCKKDRSNEVPATQATTGSTLRSTIPPDQLTYNIQGSNHSIQYQSKNYNVTVGSISNTGTYNISVSGNSGTATGRVTVVNSRAQSVSFDSKPKSNTIFESSYYQ